MAVERPCARGRPPAITSSTGQVAEAAVAQQPLRRPRAIRCRASAAGTRRGTLRRPRRKVCTLLRHARHKRHDLLPGGSPMRPIHRLRPRRRARARRSSPSSTTSAITRRSPTTCWSTGRSPVPRTGVGARARMRAPLPGPKDWLDARGARRARRRVRTVEETAGAHGRRRTRGTYTLDALPGGGDARPLRARVPPGAVRERCSARCCAAGSQRGNAQAMERCRGRSRRGPRSRRGVGAPAHFGHRETRGRVLPCRPCVTKRRSG